MLVSSQAIRRECLSMTVQVVLQEVLLEPIRSLNNLHHEMHHQLSASILTLADAILLSANHLRFVKSMISSSS